MPGVLQQRYASGSVPKREGGRGVLCICNEQQKLLIVRAKHCVCMRTSPSSAFGVVGVAEFSSSVC